MVSKTLGVARLKSNEYLGDDIPRTASLVLAEGEIPFHLEGDVRPFDGENVMRPALIGEEVAGELRRTVR